MKVLFTGSILQRQELLSYYQRIYKFLKDKGFQVLDNKILDISLNRIYDLSEEGKIKYLEDFNKWILEADLVIAEVSFPSTINIGYEVSLALQRNKPVICLYYQGRSSTVFPYINPDKLFYEEYNDKNLENVLKEALEYVDTKSDVRFNFFLPAKAVAFIDSISKRENISRSAVLRQIISEKMSNQ